MSRKILISGLSILATLGIVGAATFAYFTATADSSTNTFTAGTLNITVDQTQEISPVIDDWAPGETTTVEFTVNNTGSLPVNLRAYALGSWVSDGALDDTYVEVVRVEYNNGSSWTTIAGDDVTPITGYVYYSSDGTSSPLWELAGGATKDFRLTVLFDPNADNSYQGQNYEATIHVEAKQTDPAASWPI